MDILYTLGTNNETTILIAAISAMFAVVAAVASIQLGKSKNNSGNDYAESRKNKREKSFFFAACILFLAVFVAILAIHFWAIRRCEVPNVINLYRSEAVSRLFDANLDIDMPSNVGKDAKVTQQDPEKGKIVPVNSVVTLKFDMKTVEPATATEPPVSTATAPQQTNAEEPANTIVQTLQIGDTVLFGTYRQDSRNPDPIEWKVLDVQDGKALLLSRHGLDCIRYNEEYSPSTWATCTLRTWLNTTFLNAAFSRGEQSAIAETAVDNSAAQGNIAWSKKGSADTKDKVFLLSYAEANQYLTAYQDRVCTATDYAISQYAGTKPASDGNTYTFWWLRSPGEVNSHAAYINFEGECYSNAVGNGYISVRPALWIDLEKFTPETVGTGK